MAPRTPLILLPPSEGKATGGQGPPWQPTTMTAAGLDDRRALLLDALATAMHRPEDQRAKLLGVKGVALAAATEANLAVATGPTRPAIDRYTGVLYDALDHDTLRGPLRRRLNAQVRIVSGLWGVVAPNDPIPDYKLKMGASIEGPGKLSTWWRPAVTEVLEVETHRRTVWDLLPNEHRAAWVPDVDAGTGPSEIISVRFLDEVDRDGAIELTAVAHWNKLLKGSLVRHILTTQLTDPAGLVEFSHPQGYVYAPELTERDGTSTRLSFIRPLRRP